jgi:hypothetical protein
MPSTTDLTASASNTNTTSTQSQTQTQHNTNILFHPATRPTPITSTTPKGQHPHEDKSSSSLNFPQPIYSLKERGAKNHRSSFEASVPLLLIPPVRRAKEPSDYLASDQVAVASSVADF